MEAEYGFARSKPEPAAVQSLTGVEDVRTMALGNGQTKAAILDYLTRSVS